MSAKPTYFDELITRLEDNESIDPILLYTASNQFDGMYTELLQLRADLQAAQERIAEQARQLDEARDILQVLHDTQHSIKSQFAARKKAKNWLSSNPAQPQEQP